jgi:ATP-binding cassette subfamily B protein
MTALVRTVIAALQPDADARELSLNTSIAVYSTPVTADLRELTQTVWQRVANAISASSVGGKVTIELQRVGPNARLHVVDGTGAASVLELPLRAVSSEEQAPSGTALERSRVLVLDDEDEARELLDAILAANGAEVEKADSAGRALERLERDQDWPDLLIADIALPDMDGYELLGRVRELESVRRSGKRRIPAIALTGYGGAENRTRALLAGFQMHLTKPVEPSELIAAARSLMAQRRAA